MRVPVRWLAEWVDLPESVSALAERLSIAGLEVNEIERTGPDLGPFRVGHVVERRPHPNADRLSLCRVDLGDGAPVDIVCGAPNVAGGQRVAVVSPGSALPDGTVIRKTKIRGVTSHGMICSERELGLGEGHEGILVLDPAAPVGAPLADVIDAGESVLDVDITPNRGDWVSLLGVAREVRAFFGGPLRIPDCDPAEGPESARDAISIEIEDGDGCYRYVGRVVRGVEIGPSPEWLRRKLESAGVRAINTVVDVTNLVMLELGQPLHAFDLATLQGGVVRVRGAAPGEKLQTLDGQVRELSPDDLVIADGERAIALAGVMGGAATEVRPDTRDLLIEAAHFDPSRVRRTARRLGLHSEASYRFERGVDPDGVERAANRAARLIAELSGGEVSSGVVEALGSAPARTEEVGLDPSRVNRLLGTALADDEVAGLLERLEIRCERQPDGTLRCRVPSYRSDLHRYQDLIEEVARLHGYDRVPTTLPSGTVAPVAIPPLRALGDHARDSLCASGLVETMAFPGQRRGDLDALRLAADDARRNAIAIRNPLAEEASELWTSLVPNLLRVVRLNRARQVDAVRVFEVARVFHPRGGVDLPDEPLHVAAVLSRGEEGHLWQPAQQVPLFFEAKGVAERLLLDLGREAHFRAATPEPYLHPGAANEIELQGARVGHVGELHPEVAARFEIEVPCALLELDLSAVAAIPPREVAYEEVSRQPAVRRDVAVLLDRSLPAGEVLEAIRKTAGPHLRNVELFDRYEGKGIPAGRVSLAFRMVFQRPDRTLKDREVNKSVERVVQMLSSRFGGEQR